MDLAACWWSVEGTCIHLISFYPLPSSNISAVVAVVGQKCIVKVKMLYVVYILWYHPASQPYLPDDTLCTVYNTQ